MGNQLGAYKEIPKENKKQVWDKFFRVRIVVNVKHPIRHWVKFQDQKTKEMIRYDVKYERMPVFCYFCGIVGHSDKHCMLPEEEKMVRYCVEQKASPYKAFEHRSFYLPADTVKVKRHLQFESKSIVDWQIVDASGTIGDGLNNVEKAAAVEDTEEEERTETADPTVVMQMVAEVENLQVNEGKSSANKQIITDQQVGSAAGNLLGKNRWIKRAHTDQKKLSATHARSGGRLAQEALEATGRSLLMRVPPIEDCLRPDSSLLEEIRADAVHKASSVPKQKSKILGKRPGSNDSLMQDAEQNLEGRLGEEARKKTRGEGQTTHGEQVEGEAVKDKEATSLGAAGTLTGAEDRACQEP
jgi:cytochrome c